MRAWILLLAALPACGGSETRAAGTAEGFSFVDVAAERGIDVVNRSGDPRRWYIVESNGCGAAWLDFDGDRDLDLFVANGSGLRYHDDGARLEVLHDASSRLYRNDGPGKRFADVTREAGAGRSEWINAVATGDVDGDGDTDLYLACFGKDVLLRNDGGRFVDATAEAGLGCELWGASAAFGDADDDGDLDLYVANYCVFDPERPPDGGKRNTAYGAEVGWGPEEENKKGFNAGAPDVFYLNDGSGRFAESTARAGLALAKPACSYACVFTDVDGDGCQDILVANDLQPCNLFVNLGVRDGCVRFEERGERSGFAFEAGGKATGAMGLALADIDRDGDQDVYRSNFDLEANSLHVNDGKGGFADRAAVLGLAEPSFDRLGWGCAFADVDLDGDPDLLVANGHVYPQAAEIGMHPWLQSSQLYEALEDEDGIRWRDATASAGPDLGRPRSARGLAVADYDDDGDLDALLVDIDERPRLLENRSRRHGRWLLVRAIGTASNRDGYGAVVTVDAGGRTWTREVRTNDGLYSAHDPRVHFGLGPVERADRVSVRWPSGARSEVKLPELDRVLTIVEPAGASPDTEASPDTGASSGVRPASYPASNEAPR